MAYIIANKDWENQKERKKEVKEIVYVIEKPQENKDFTNLENFSENLQNRPILQLIKNNKCN